MSNELKEHRSDLFGSRVCRGRERLAVLVIGVAMSLASPDVYSAGESTFKVVLQFAVTDNRAEFSVPLSRDVLLNVRRTVDAHGNHIGWDLAASDRRLKGYSNFFYDCLCGHGPRPNDLYAWHFVSNYYPDERRLPVYGYPLEVRVRCVDCAVAGVTTNDVRFVHGSVELSVRPLASANPRQRRISDIIRPQDK
jgi:hypothetical protein